MARRIYTAEFSRNSVLEVKETAKVKESGEWKEYHGRVVVRAATLQSGDNHREIAMLLSPVECYKIGLVIKQVAKATQPIRKKVIVHKPEESKFSELIVEYWRNDNRSGYAIILQLREGDNVVKVNVPLDRINFLALGEFFKNLNTLLRWKEIVRVEVEQQEPHEAPADEPVIDDDDLDDIEL